MPEATENNLATQTPPPTGVNQPFQPQKPKKKRLGFNKLFLSTYFRIGFTFLLMIILFLTASFIAFRSEQRKRQLEDYEKKVPDAEIIVPESSDASTENWEIYTHDILNFSFRYPPDITLLEPNRNPENEFALSLIVDKVNEIDLKQPTNLGYDGETSTLDREALENGEYGNTVDFDNLLSRKVINLGKTNGKSFTVLGRFDTCDYTFERKLIFYQDDSRIILTLYGPEEIIKQESSEYFSEIGCGGRIGWDYNNNAQERFSENLVSRNAPPTAQKWYDTFDQILSTLRFNSGQ